MLGWLGVRAWLQCVASYTSNAPSTPTTVESMLAVWLATVQYLLLFLNNNMDGWIWFFVDFPFDSRRLVGYNHKLSLRQKQKSKMTGWLASSVHPCRNWYPEQRDQQFGQMLLHCQLHPTTTAYSSHGWRWKQKQRQSQHWKHGSWFGLRLWKGQQNSPASQLCSHIHPQLENKTLFLSNNHRQLS